MTEDNKPLTTEEVREQLRKVYTVPSPEYQAKLDYLRGLLPDDKFSNEIVLLMEIDRLQSILRYVRDWSKQELIRAAAENGLSY